MRTGVLALAILVAGCATGPAAAPSGPTPSAPPPPVAAPTPAPATPPPAARSPATLPGWAGEDHLAAFEAYAVGCGVARETAARLQCDRALLLRRAVGSSRVDLQACKLEYSIVSPK